jgi:hypothetical protein
LVFWAVFVVFTDKVVNELLPAGWHPYDMLRWYDNPDTPIFRMVQLPAAVERLLILLIQYSFPPAFWVITYFRLKEKEV